MKKLLIIALTVLALTSTSLGSQARVGSSGAQFLEIGVGSKYQGMAEASVAMVDDAYAMYWNPAGLVNVENWAVAFTNVNWLLDIDLNYVGIAKNFEDVGVFGASVTVLSMGDQEITTVLEQDGTGKTYSASSYALGVSFARQLTNRFAFGGSIKYVGENIGNVDSKGIALDFGTLLYTGYNSLRIGMSIANMGPDLKFTGSALSVPYDPLGDNDNNTPVDADLATTPYNLPLTFRVGAAYDFEMTSESILTMSGEFQHPSDNDQRGSLGTQLAFQEKFFVRGGYKFNYDEEGLALGGGLIAPVGKGTSLSIDYAWQDFGRLESTQRFSVGFVF